MSIWLSGNGWQRGMSAAVCFAASIPAMRAISKGLPLGRMLLRILVTIDSGIITRAEAVALRAVTAFALTSTI